MAKVVTSWNLAIPKKIFSVKVQLDSMHTKKIVQSDHRHSSQQHLNSLVAGSFGKQDACLIQKGLMIL